MEELYFMVGSGLKNLMGKDSIIDRNVAIYELVKNAIDAKSSEIHVNFIGEKTSDGINIIHKIEIWDDGKGMDFDDIKNKWLKVAYSAKKEGVEDKGNTTEVYAGEKGIGRFACDTLGSKLDLYATTKNDVKMHHIFVDWIDFEKDAKLKFQEIPISYEQVDKNFQHGAKISITNIRGTWTKDDLKKLKRGLSRLLAPKMAGDTSNAPRVFLETNFEDGVYVEGDDIKTYYNIINGEIKNFAFSELEKRVISIHGKISDDGTIFEASLFDKGEEIYYFKQYNEFPLCKGISINLSFLDRGAKKSFNALTGLHAKDFGSIFVYRNGFRILPYGSPGDDSFGIDLRKAQGYSRFLGNRELMGEILIGKQADGFMETANRDSGFIKNSSFFELNKFLVDSVIARFEKYIRAVKWYGLDEIIADEDGEDSHISKVSEDIAKVIASIGKMKGIIEFRFSESISDIITSTNSTEFLINRIKEGNKDEQIAATRKLEFKVKEFERKDKTSKNIFKEKDEKLEKFSSSLEDEKRTNKFLLATTRNSIKVSELAHNLKGYSAGLQSKLSYITQLLENNIDKKKINKTISECLMYSYRIDKFVQFASVADFDLQSSEKYGNIIDYIKEYISESKESIEDYEEWAVVYSGIDSYETIFTPMDISIILDNLFSNARKALKNTQESRLIDISFENVIGDKLAIKFTNYGSYIAKVDLERIFDLGHTTTMGGSGLGLSMVKRILEDANGSIICESSNSQEGKKTTFNIYLPRNAKNI